jgi:hypothetical protein
LREGEWETVEELEHYLGVCSACVSDNISACERGYLLTLYHLASVVL